MRFYENDIAVVSYAGVFPDADDENLFFQNLLKGHCAIGDLLGEANDGVVDFRNHYSSDKSLPDKTYARFGTKIPYTKFLEWAERNEIDPNRSTTYEICMHELFRRMNNKTPGLFGSRRAECMVSMATGEPHTVRVRSGSLARKWLENYELNDETRERLNKDLSLIMNNPKRAALMPKDLFCTLAYESVRSRFGIEGPCSYVDAACASSLAAFTLAVHRLRSGDCDLAVAGGIDFGLGVLTLAAFSRVKVLSEKIMNPFDESADGMNQGEAAALFALMRLKDARAEGFPIYGVIRNCDGSSDGIHGGIVEPTEHGQVLAYERAYRNVPLEDVSYIECHGTGTVLGDKTELASINKFFHPLPPIGSVKANVGHTIGAAGAVALMKALKIIENKVIPIMPNYKKCGSKTPHMIHRENHSLADLDQIRIGVSSFGFGGANFHLVLDSYQGEVPVSAPVQSADSFRFVMNGEVEVDLEFARELLASSKVKIPPVSLPFFDDVIIGAALATEQLFNRLNIRLSPQLRENVGVISVTNGFLDCFEDCHDKVAYLELAVRMTDKDPKSAIVREKLKAELEKFLPITEDTFPGALNNLIAGKITKDHDLKGVNFNISGEKAGLGLALSYASSLLKGRSGAFVLIDVLEDPDIEQGRLKRKAVRAYLVSDLEFALKANLPIAAEVTAIHAERRRAEHDKESWNCPEI